MIYGPLAFNLFSKLFKLLSAVFREIEPYTVQGQNSFE
jgi:hypothetical protein